MNDLYLVAAVVLGVALVTVCTAALAEAVTSRKGGQMVSRKGAAAVRRGATRIKSWAADKEPSLSSS